MYLQIPHDHPDLRLQGNIQLYRNLPLSGQLYILGNKTTDTLQYTCYLAGKKHGYSRMFYGNGQPKSEQYYRHGKAENTYTKWWPNGHLRRIAELQNGVFHGEVKEWNMHGILILHMNYVHGHEEGTQRVWYNNGKIKSNYVVKNGRRYGLLGTKNCVNVALDIYDSMPYTSPTP